MVLLLQFPEPPLQGGPFEPGVLYTTFKNMVDSIYTSKKETLPFTSIGDLALPVGECSLPLCATCYLVHAHNSVVFTTTVKLLQPNDPYILGHFIPPHHASPHHGPPSSRGSRLQPLHTWPLLTPHLASPYHVSPSPRRLRLQPSPIK